MFISATGARVIRRAQANAEVFSGNSERNGATHWMKTNWEIPRLTASASMELRKGSATKKMTAPPADEEAADGRPALRTREGEGPARHRRDLLVLLDRLGPRRHPEQDRRGRRRRSPTRIAESTSERFPFAQTTTK